MISDIRAPLAGALSIIAHDPGASPGYAVLGNHPGGWRLTWTAAALPEPMQGRHWPGWCVAISEIPEHRVQGAKRKRIDVNALIRLAWTGGGQARDIRAAHRFEVRPSHWKGSVSKRVHHGRILKRLSPEERALITSGRCADCKATHNGNVLDAVGLGIWYVGRWTE